MAVCVARDPWSPPIHGWGGIFHGWGPYPWISALTRRPFYSSRGGKSTGRVKNPRVGWVKTMGKPSVYFIPFSSPPILWAHTCGFFTLFVSNRIDEYVQRSMDGVPIHGWRVACNICIRGVDITYSHNKSCDRSMR